MDFRISDWISGFQSGFLDFNWISGFQIGFLPTVYEISFGADPSTRSWFSRSGGREGGATTSVQGGWDDVTDKLTICCSGTKTKKITSFRTLI